MDLGLEFSVKRTTTMANIRLRRDISFDHDVNKRDVMEKSFPKNKFEKFDWIEIEDLSRKRVMFAQIENSFLKKLHL